MRCMMKDKMMRPLTRTMGGGSRAGATSGLGAGGVSACGWVETAPGIFAMVICDVGLACVPGGGVLFSRAGDGRRNGHGGVGG